MPTLDDLMGKFASPTGGSSPTTPNPAVVGDGHLKTAGEKNMNSLADIYMAISGQDHVKEASQAANAPAPAAHGAAAEDDDFAKMAEQLAEQEAASQISEEETGSDMMKVAAEYDSAGRIMARGFYDEFCKLAANMTTEPDNQRTESESSAKTPALGERGLPTLETNYAGTVDTNKPGQQPQMNGPGPKQTYANSLETSKTISAGQGTGDDPEAGAISLGGGSPVGFATVRDLQA